MQRNQTISNLKFLSCGFGKLIIVTALLWHTMNTCVGARELGLALNQNSSYSFRQAFSDWLSSGAHYLELPIAWDDVEVSPGELNPSPDFATIANATYPPLNVKVSLSFLTLDTFADRRPLHLKGLPWNDPLVIDAAWFALRHTLTSLKDTTLVSISLGNEANIGLFNNQDRAAFLEFATILETRLDTFRPNVPVGVKTTYSGLSSNSRDWIGDLVNAMDAAMLTYFPLDINFRAQAPNVVRRDINAMKRFFPNKPIHLSEVGYPSSEVCGSSQAKQAEFIEVFFKVWRSQGSKIPLALIDWQIDVDDSVIDFFALYYGSNNPCFLSFLASLGLHDQNGNPTIGIKCSVA